jgi:8-oxo-dGTP diphosphatase
VFVAKAEGTPRGADDANEARPFSKEDLPKELAFDHGVILEDYFTGRY